MSVKNKIKSILAGGKVFYIYGNGLSRFALGSCKEQCEAKFTGHYVRKANIFESIKYYLYR